jgi:hypothetical protein
VEEMAASWTYYVVGVDFLALSIALGGICPLHFSTYDVVGISRERSYRIQQGLDSGDVDF